MIKLRVKAVCTERMLRNPRATLIKAGISATKTDQYLSGNTNWIMVDDIEKLCLLLRCAPNDLFEWTPNNRAVDYADNPLQAIGKKPLFATEDILKGMTIAEVRARLGGDKEKDK